MPRVLACLNLILALLLWAAAAQAQKIALVLTAGDDKIVNRVNAELSALGFDVELVNESPSSEPNTLQQLAESRSAIAGLRAAPSKTGIELWIVNPSTGTTAFEEVVTVNTGRNDELLALRAVEVLRARLLKLGVQSGPPPPERPPPAAPSPTPPAPAPSERLPEVTSLADEQPFLWIDLGVSYNFEASALSSYESVRLGVSVSPDARWSISAFSMLPLRPARVSNQAGSADTDAMLFALAGEGQLNQGRFQASLGGGGALALLDVEGTASFPFEGQSTRLVTGVPFVRVGAAGRLASQALLRGDLMLGWAVPTSVIRLNQEDVAHWGNPFVALTLTLQLGILTLDP